MPPGAAPWDELLLALAAIASKGRIGRLVGSVYAANTVGYCRRHANSLVAIATLGTGQPAGLMIIAAISALMMFTLGLSQSRYLCAGARGGRLGIVTVG